MRRLLIRAGALALLALILAACFAAAAAGYSDTAGHWAEEPIERWSRQHIIEGYDGAFRPDEPMTRGEIAKVIARLLGLTETPAQNPFTDVDEAAWYAPYVLRLYAAGILQGDEQHRAAPESPITRQDAMVLFCRAFGIGARDDADLSGFTDAGDVAGYALGYVKALTAAGIVRGVTDTELCPQRSIDRAGVVKLIDGLAEATLFRLPGETVGGDPDHDHVWDEGMVTRAPTCETVGERTFTCTGCGAERTEIIAATGHAWGPWHADENGHWRVCANDAGHTERHAPVWVEAESRNGKRRYVCDLCGQKTDSVALALTEAFPKFFLSEPDGAAGGAPVTLSADCFKDANGAALEYQWYVCAGIDGSGGVPIPGATGITYQTEGFAESAVRYYYCAVSLPGDGQDGAPAQTVRTGVYAVGCTGLPAIYIEAEQPVTKEAYVEAHLRLVTGAAETTLDCPITIKGRGNSSWGMPKKGYNFKFAQKTEVLGLGKDKKWTLIANYADKSLLRNWFASDLTAEVWRDEDAWNPSYLPVDFVLNGEYVGSYNLVDSVKIGKNRVDIPSIEDVYDEAAAAGGEIDLSAGGFVLEVDTRMDASHYFKTARGVAFTLKDPDLDGADAAKSEAVCGAIRDHIQTVEDALYSRVFADPEKGYARYLDVDSFVDWYLVNELTKNLDARFRTSVFMYYDPADGLLHMGPNWDFDLACGNFRSSNVENPEGYWIRNAKWIGRLMEDPAFRARVRERWNGGREALYAAIHGSIQAQADAIEVSAGLNFDRWPILGVYVWPNPDGYKARNTYQLEVEALVDWLDARYAWLDAALNG